MCFFNGVFKKFIGRNPRLSHEFTHTPPRGTQSTDELFFGEKYSKIPHLLKSDSLHMLRLRSKPKPLPAFELILTAGGKWPMRGLSFALRAALEQEQECSQLEFEPSITAPPSQLGREHPPPALGFKPRASHMLGKGPITELCSQSFAVAVAVVVVGFAFLRWCPLFSPGWPTTVYMYLARFMILLPQSPKC